VSDAKTQEKNLWYWLRDGTRGDPWLRMDRIENRVSSGMPDVAGCTNGREFWIELKTCARPKRPTTKLDIGLRKEQREWLFNSWTDVLRRCFILIQVGSGHGAERYLVRGSQARKVFEGLTELELSDIAFSAIDRPMDVVDHATVDHHAFVRNERERVEQKPDTPCCGENRR